MPDPADATATADKIRAEIEKARAEAAKALADARKAEAEAAKLGEDRRFFNRHLGASLTFVAALLTAGLTYVSWVTNVERQRQEAGRAAFNLLLDHRDKIAEGQGEPRVAFARMIAAIIPYEQAEPMLRAAEEMWGTRAETRAGIREVREQLAASRPPGIWSAWFGGGSGGSGQHAMLATPRPPAGEPPLPTARPPPLSEPGPDRPPGGTQPLPYPATGPPPEAERPGMAPAAAGRRFLLFAHIAAGEDRAAARELLARLDADGFELAGVEAVPGWAGARGEVRYYRPAQRDFASWLAAELTRRLPPGSPPVVALDISRAFPGLPDGRMEVWLPRTK
ncbi:MAG: hypothetical protein ACK4PG_11065 [Acetobacteraceae bacterium]